MDSLRQDSDFHYHEERRARMKYYIGSVEVFIPFSQNCGKRFYLLFASRQKPPRVRFEDALDFRARV
jgi:hypothetical protein